MKEKDFSSIASEFRNSIEEALKEILDIKDELPDELLRAKEKIDRLEATIKKQKKMLEGFIVKR